MLTTNWSNPIKVLQGVNPGPMTHLNGKVQLFTNGTLFVIESPF